MKPNNLAGVSTALGFFALHNQPREPLGPRRCSSLPSSPES